HSADRAATGALLPDFRVHGTGVDRARRRRCRFVSIRAEILFRIGGEPAPAPRAAEVVLDPGMLVAVSGVGRAHDHTAHWIRRSGGRRPGPAGLRMAMTTSRFRLAVMVRLRPFVHVQTLRPICAHPPLEDAEPVKALDAIYLRGVWYQAWTKERKRTSRSACGESKGRCAASVGWSRRIVIASTCCTSCRRCGQRFTRWRRRSSRITFTIASLTRSRAAMRPIRTRRSRS